MNFSSSSVLLTLSIILNVIAGGVLRGKFCKNEIRSDSDMYAFNGLSSVVSAVTLMAVAWLSGSLVVPSWYTVWMSIIFGVITALATIFNMLALQIGPMSYTTVICCCSMLIPSLSGMVLYGESISVRQYVGILLIIGSFLCATDRKNDTAGASLKWLIFSVGSFLASGGVGVMQKIHQNSPYRDELGIFLVVAFIFSAAFSQMILLYLRYRKNQSVSVTEKGKKSKFIFYCAVCGVGIAIVNQLNMYLAGVMESVIFFPVFNGSVILLMSVIGVCIWKERLSPRQWFGIFIGTLAILFLCLG